MVINLTFTKSRIKKPLPSYGQMRPRELHEFSVAHTNIFRHGPLPGPTDREFQIQPQQLRSGATGLAPRPLGDSPINWDVLAPACGPLPSCSCLRARLGTAQIKVWVKSYQPTCLSLGPSMTRCTFIQAVPAHSTHSAACFFGPACPEEPARLQFNATVQISETYEFSSVHT